MNELIDDEYVVFPFVIYLVGSFVFALIEDKKVAQRENLLWVTGIVRSLNVKFLVSASSFNESV